MITYARALELSDLDDEELGGGPSAEGQITEAIEDIQVSLAEASGFGVCQELTTGAERAVAHAAPRGAPLTCTEAVERAAGVRRRAGRATVLSRVLSVAVRGNQAVARAEAPGGDIRDIPFVEERGLAWKAFDLGLIDKEITAAR